MAQLTSWFIQWASNNFGHPLWDAHFLLAAAAAIVIAAIVAVATAAEEQNQNDDPPAAVPTKTIVTHNEYLRYFLSGNTAHSKIFHRQKKVQRYEIQFIAQSGVRQTSR